LSSDQKQSNNTVNNTDVSNTGEEFEIRDLSDLEEFRGADEKTYEYYFPELALEQGLLTKDAIRNERRMEHQYIRNIFPPLENI